MKLQKAMIKQSKALLEKQEIVFDIEVTRKELLDTKDELEDLKRVYRNPCQENKKQNVELESSFQESDTIQIKTENEHTEKKVVVKDINEIKLGDSSNRNYVVITSKVSTSETPASSKPITASASISTSTSSATLSRSSPETASCCSHQKQCISPSLLLLRSAPSSSTLGPSTTSMLAALLEYLPGITLMRTVWGLITTNIDVLAVCECVI